MIGFWIFMLIMTLLVPLTMLLFGQRFTRKPPAQINSSFGYRTKRSMHSKAAWEFAHRHFGRVWRLCGAILTPACTLVMLLCLTKDVTTVSIYSCVLLGVQLVICMLTLIPTEIALKRKFGK